MMKCLLTAKSSIEVVAYSLLSCFRFYGKSNCLDVEAVFTLIRLLLEVNPAVIEYVDRGEDDADDDDSDGANLLHWACQHLEGELGVAIMSLFSSKYGDNVGALLRA
jgi:hypothetical protein